MGFSVLTMPEKHIKESPAEGVYVRGMFLECAGFDDRNTCLIEPKPMQLTVSMPPIWFKPSQKAAKKSKTIYQCPVFYYSERSSSFIVAVDLKTAAGDKNASSENMSDFWTKRGAAMLLSLDN